MNKYRIEAARPVRLTHFETWIVKRYPIADVQLEGTYVVRHEEHPKSRFGKAWVIYRSLQPDSTPGVVVVGRKLYYSRSVNRCFSVLRNYDFGEE